MTRSRALIVALALTMVAILAAAWWASRGASSAPSTAADLDPSTSTASVGATDEIFGPLVLDVSSNGSLIRAQLGSCTSASEPTVWVTDGASEAFVETSTVPLSKIQSANIDGDDLTLIGADEDCTATKATSDDGGQSWTTEEDDSIPSDSNTCAIASVHDGADEALALCGDGGSISRITSEGEVNGITGLPEITGVAQTQDETFYAIVSTESCSSRVLEYGTAEVGDSEEEQWSELSCIGFRTAATGLAIDEDDTMYVQAGNDLLISDDGLEWTNPLDG